MDLINKSFREDKNNISKTYLSLSVALLLTSFTQAFAIEDTFRPPTDSDILGKSFGGTKADIDAYKDGNGVVVVCPSAKQCADYKGYNDTVYKLGEKAKEENKAVLADTLGGNLGDASDIEKLSNYVGKPEGYDFNLPTNIFENFQESLTVIGNNPLPVTYEWFVNGTSVGTGTQITLNPTSGTNEIKVVVTNSKGSTEFKKVREVPRSFNSCYEWKTLGNALKDGKYRLNTGTSGEFNGYCNMTIDGGGWTAIASFVDASYFHIQSNHAGGVTGAEESIAKAVYNAPTIKGSADTLFSTDTVLTSYKVNNLKEFMFSDNSNSRYISYSLTANSMEAYYDSIASSYTPLRHRLNPTRTNVSTSVNNCSTLQIALDSADNDGGPINYESKRTSGSAQISYGPAWDAGNNNGCHFDDESGHAFGRRLGGINAPNSSYLIWWVR